MPDIQVGDTITTVDQLEALPVGTVIRSEGGLVAERYDSDFSWRMAGDDWTRHIDDDRAAHHAPWTVLYLPPPPPVTEVTFDATVSGYELHMYGPALMELNRMDGAKVTVIVRRKDTDDA